MSTSKIVPSKSMPSSKQTKRPKPQPVPPTQVPTMSPNTEAHMRRMQRKLTTAKNRKKKERALRAQFDVWPDDVDQPAIAENLRDCPATLAVASEQEVVDAQSAKIEAYQAIIRNNAIVGEKSDRQERELNKLQAAVKGPTHTRAMEIQTKIQAEYDVGVDRHLSAQKWLAKEASALESIANRLAAAMRTAEKAKKAEAPPPPPEEPSHIVVFEQPKVCLKKLLEATHDLDIDFSSTALGVVQGATQ